MSYNTELLEGQGIVLERSALGVRIHAIEQLPPQQSCSGYLTADFYDSNRSEIIVADGSLPRTQQENSPAAAFNLDYIWRDAEEEEMLKISHYTLFINTMKITVPSSSAMLFLCISIAQGSGTYAFSHPRFGSYHLAVSLKWYSSHPANKAMTFYFPVARYLKTPTGIQLEQLHFGVPSAMIVSSTPLVIPELPESSSSEETERSSSSESSSSSENSSSSESPSDEPEVPPEDPSTSDEPVPPQPDDPTGFYIVDQFIYSGPYCTGEFEGTAMVRMILEYPYPSCEDVIDGDEFLYSLKTKTLLEPYPTFAEAELHRGDEIPE